MQEAPSQEGTVALDPSLRFLKTLVTILTATMILGVITFVTVFVIRFPSVTALSLPQGLKLPAGEVAQAVTQGKGWVAIVTESNKILVYDGATGALKQTVTLTP